MLNSQNAEGSDIESMKVSRAGGPLRIASVRNKLSKSRLDVLGSTPTFGLVTF